MNEEKKVKRKRVFVKTILCLVYLGIMAILFTCSYRLYRENKKILSWNEVESVEDYTYFDISRMSEKFAESKKENIGYHFVTIQEDQDGWNTYIVAINENEYQTYKSIIAYMYERTDKKPDSIRVYGYPTIIKDEIKELAISNISAFIPSDTEIVIDTENYEQYLTNCYLNTTKEKKDDFNVILCISLFLLFIVFVLFVLTIIDKDKIVDSLSEEEKEELKPRRKK